MRTSSVNKKTFYDRWGWLVLIASLSMVPFAFYGAGKAIQSNVNKVEDWLPKTFAETGELKWFRKNFPTDQFVIISWDGCRLGGNPAEGGEPDDPRIAELASLFAPQNVDPNDLDAVDAKKYFKGVSTGRQVLDQLTSGQHPLSYTEAVERLKGSLIGRDGHQTCLIVSLDPATTAKLKPILGQSRARPFAPPIPAGVIRRLIARVGIPDESLHMGGPPIDNIAIDEEGERTLVRLAGLSGLLGLVLAWWSLRSVILTWIVFLSSVISAAASMAMIYYTGETVDAIVLSMPSLVYVLSISGAVHFVNYYKDAVQEGGLHGATERAVVHALKPAILCSTTTAIGLLSLCTSELVPIRKFGFYSATGVTFMIVVLYLILPAALHVLGYAKRWVVKESDLATHVDKKTSKTKQVIADTYGERFWAMVASFIVRNHFGVAAGCVLFVGVIGYGVTMTRTSINLLELFDSQARILKDYRWLEKNLGMLVPLEIVIDFDANSIAKSTISDVSDDNANDTNDSANVTPNIDEKTRLRFLERMETVAKIQETINNRFGENGAGIVGKSLSAASFASSLPSKGTSTQTLVQRNTYNFALESKKDELMNSGFLKIDPHTQNELWRISLRVAAFEGVDYGAFVTDLRNVVTPILEAHNDRVRILKSLANWSDGSNFAGKSVLLWDPAPNRTEGSTEISPESKTRSDEIASLLANSRIKVKRLDISPSIPIVQLQKLNDYDAIVLTGEFSNAEIGTFSASLNHVIDLKSKDAESPRHWVSSVYTGVVPIVYKAQRALLQSLVESTFWSFITITPLMMFVSRSFRAGIVAMIPNVLPVLVIFGAMGWMGVAIDIGSMMTASIALGVAVDDTIHFLSWFRGDLMEIRDRRLAIVACYKRCATPTLQAACISGLGLSVFAFSTFTPTQRFGWLMLTILIAGVVAELIMLPAILAGPLGRVFDYQHARHNTFSRALLILRYQLRKRFEKKSKSAPVVTNESKLQSAA